MRHTFLVVTVKRWLKSVTEVIAKLKREFPFFGPLCNVSDQCHLESESKVQQTSSQLTCFGLNNCCFHMRSARFKKHQNQQRWVGASCPSPRTPPPASALRASGFGPSGLAPPSPPILNTDRRHWLQCPLPRIFGQELPLTTYCLAHYLATSH